MLIQTLFLPVQYGLWVAYCPCFYQALTCYISHFLCQMYWLSKISCHNSLYVILRVNSFLAGAAGISLHIFNVIVFARLRTPSILCKSHEPYHVPPVVTIHYYGNWIKTNSILQRRWFNQKAKLLFRLLNYIFILQFFREFSSVVGFPYNPAF